MLTRRNAMQEAQPSKAFLRDEIGDRQIHKQFLPTRRFQGGHSGVQILLSLLILQKVEFSAMQPGLSI